MRAAHAAGLRVIPMGANKQPAIPWKGRGMAELDELEHWAHGDYDGYAILCGGEQRLVVFDFEGGFDFLGFVELLRDVDLYDLFEGWLRAYRVGTPGEGIHVAVYLGGDGAVPGNTKLSFDEEGKTTAETRGEGGLIVGPGSGGRVHPTSRYWILAPGGGFEQICLVTPEEYQAVCEVIVKMSAATPPPLAPADQGIHLATGSPSSAGGVSLAELERSSSYLDEAKAAMPSMAEVLIRYGWVLHHQDADYTYWTRPGKDPREGVSATINAADRLFVFSSNAHPVPASPGRTTYSVIDVLAFYQGVDGGEIVKQYKPERLTTTAAPSPSSLILPIEFWTSRPYLEHLAQAAWSRQVSPDLVWEAFKAMYASTIPWNFRLPGEGTLDYISVMVGDSGSGKTQAKRCAASLLPEAVFEIEGLNPLLPPPASGEGMAEWFLDRSKNAAPGALANRGGCMYLDEGQQFFDVAGRQGNITIQTIKSIWSGELVGSLAAAHDRRRVIQPMAVRACILISIQIAAAAQFLAADLTAGGLPQRISWGWAYHTNIPDEIGEWPGRLDVPVYDYHHWGGGTENILHQIAVDRTVQEEVDARRLARRRSPQPDALEAQADLAKLKTAAILALLDHRTDIQPSDWQLAAHDWNTSVSIREHILATQTEASADRNSALGRADAVRTTAARFHRLDLAASALGRRIWRTEDPVPTRQAKDAVKQYGVGPFTAIRELAIELGYIVIHSEGGLSRGGTRPPRRGG